MNHVMRITFLISSNDSDGGGAWSNRTTTTMCRAFRYFWARRTTTMATKLFRLRSCPGERRNLHRESPVDVLGGKATWALHVVRPDWRWWLSIKIMWKLIRLRKAQFQKGFVLFGLGVVPVWLTATGGGCQPCFQFVSPCSGYVVAALSDDMCKDKTFLEVNVIPAEKSTSMAHLVLNEEIWAKCNLQRK